MFPNKAKSPKQYFFSTTSLFCSYFSLSSQKIVGIKSYHPYLREVSLKKSNKVIAKASNFAKTKNDSWNYRPTYNEKCRGGREGMVVMVLSSVDDGGFCSVALEESIKF